MINIITVPVTGFAQNCRFIVCEQTKKAAVVDPGGDINKLKQVIEQYQLCLVAVYLTHGHLDHVGAAKQLCDEFNIDMIGPHQDDKFWFDALPMQAQMFGFVGVEPFYPDKWLADGDTISVGDLHFEVRHCPGHTPGHVVFYQAEHKQLIVGDVIFKGSVGRTDFPKGDSEQLLASIKSKILQLDDDIAILPGHGPNTTVGAERRTNPFISGKFG